jgi:hypothetical protein
MGPGRVTPVTPAAAGPAPYSLLCVDSTPEPGQAQPVRPVQPARPDTAGAGSAYAVLFLLGVMEGLLGCFQFSHVIGPVPVAALAFCVVIFATCLLAGLGMGSPMGALVPAFGWFLASFVLTMPTAAGSVIVTDTTAGKWYLYGGAASVGLGVVLTFVLSRRGGRWPRRVGVWPR